MVVIHTKSLSWWDHDLVPVPDQICDVMPVPNQICDVMPVPDQ